MPIKLTPAECQALDTKIKALLQNYEDLLSGTKARVLVDQNGERIEYNGGNSRNLWNYIQMLKADYEAGGCTVNLTRRGPIRPFF